MKNSITLLFVLLYGSLLGQTIPDGYYNGTAELSGEALKTILHQISRGHTVRSYSEFRDVILPDLDEDPENTDNIILFYKNNSIPKQSFASNNEPDFWNREHTWPSSHGFSDNSDTAYTDVHNLRPSDATVNSSKSNKDFEDIENSVENEEGEAPDTYTNADFFEPRDAIKGDVARILFYMDMRYESERLDLELVSRETFTGDPEMGVLNTLIQWHENDPVDQYEIDRHEKAYGYQNNRNPFVDHPEWVAEIWGSSTDPYMNVDQLNFSPDFGMVEAGTTFGQQYTLIGNNLTADVTVSVESPFQVSVNGETYANEVTLTHDEGESTEEFTVYLQFAPSAEDGASYERTVTHTSSGANDVTIDVMGTEGSVEIITIADARAKELGEVVYVTGVVIDEGNNSSNSRVIYDGTAGIVVRSFDAGNESSGLSQGDSIVVSGGLSEYNSLLQIEESPIVITIVSQGIALPDPLELTIDEIGEEYESQLVTIKGVRFDRPGSAFQGGGSAGNFIIEDNTGSLTLRIGSSAHPLVGTTVPEGLFDVTGFVGQFGSDYQISPRSASDLVLAGQGEVLYAEKGILTVYPNPVSQKLIIAGEGLIEVQVYSEAGVKLYQCSAESENLHIQMNDFESGLYLIRIQTATNTRTYKVIKK